MSAEPGHRAALANRHRHLIEALPQCVWVTDHDGALLECNRFWHEYTGVSRDERSDGAWERTIHPDDLPRVVAEWKRHLADGTEWRFEFRLRRADGAWHWHDARYMPVRDEHGEMIAWLGIAFDVEDTRRTLERHALLSAAVQSSGDAIVTKTLDGIVTSWNRGAEILFGYSADEMVGRPISALLPPDRRGETPAILERLRRGERIEHLETQRVRKDGRILDIALTISPVWNAGGELIGASSIKRDVTERKRLEATLRESEERFRVMADSAPLLIWTSDAAGSPDYFNRRWWEHDHLPPSEPFTADRWRAVTHPADVRRVMATWFGCIHAGETFTTEYRLLARDGSGYRWHLARAVPVRDPGGAIVRWVGSCMDIEDQKRAEQQLLQHASLLSQRVEERTSELESRNEQMVTFSYTVSHDLRAPLRAMRGYLDTMLEEIGPEAPPAVVEYGRRIAAATVRMDRLIRELLEYGRMGVIPIESEPVRLQDVVLDALQQLEEEVRERHAHIEVAVRDLPEVQAHPAVLTQVVFNLVGNAIKFVAPGVEPRVSIRGEVVGARVRLWVEDNGIGIAPEHHAKIFGVFEQLHPGGSFEGTGIGLAMVQRAVERMGGQVLLESEPGRGSRFGIELPTHVPVI